MFSTLRIWLEKAKKHISAILIVSFLIAIIFLGVGIVGGYWFHWNWTGFGAYTHQNVFQREKTLWDWMQLFIVPVVIAGGAYIFSIVAKSNAEETAEVERVRDYLNKMSDLLNEMSDLVVENNVHKPKNKQIEVMIRAQALTVLRTVHAGRKGYILQFLSEADLVNVITKKPSLLEGADFSGAKLGRIELRGTLLNDIDFEHANLSNAQLRSCNLKRANLSNCQLQGASLHGAQLKKANLRAADLSGAHLSDKQIFDDIEASEPIDYLEAADLSYADLSSIVRKAFVKRKLAFTYILETKLCEADLENAFLDHANLTRANLKGTHLSRADLSYAKLQNADLSGADLSDAYLTGAKLQNANLSGADLSRADLTKSNITDEQLKAAKSYQDAIMPYMKK